MLYIYYMAKQENDDKPQLYTRLPVLRAERGMSRKDLADLAGVHYQTIGYLERGEYSPSLVLALRIAAALGVPLDAVFSLAPFPSMADQLYNSEGNKR